LLTLDDPDEVPRQELILSKMVEEDESLKNYILQLILYQKDIQIIASAINGYFRDDPDQQFVHIATF